MPSPIPRWTVLCEVERKLRPFPDVHAPVAAALGPVRERMAMVHIETRSEANKHEFWRARQKRAKTQHMHVSGVLAATFGRAPKPPLGFVLRRVAPRQLDHSDNVNTSMKFPRDACAKGVGRDARDPRIAWIYEQRNGGVREYAVEIILITPNIDGATA